MLFHEIGHAVQHANCDSLSYKTNPIDFESPLSYLFNGSSRPHVISILLRKNYQEAYSDCYAAYCIFKKDNNVNIFDDIYDYRKQSILDFKSQQADYLNQYSNIEALLEFKNLILTNSNLSFEMVHKLIEQAIIKTSKNFLLEELKTNDSLLREVIDFGLEFNKTDGFMGFWEQFKTRDKTNSISSQELNQILNNLIYQRHFNNNIPLLNKTDFGWDNNNRLFSKEAMLLIRKKFNDKNSTSTLIPK